MSNTCSTPNSNRGSTAQILCNVPFANPLVLDSLVASIDSLRIKFEYSKTDYDHENFQTFDTINDILCRLNSVEFWTENHIDTEVNTSSFKIGKYQYTMTFRIGAGVSFTILAGRYCCDNAVKLVAPEIVLDVNPNKVPDAIWHKVARILFVKAHKVSLQRFDLALDFPIARNLLHLMPKSSSTYTKIISSDYQEIIQLGVKTEYLGKRSKHGAVKLYDKSFEIKKDHENIPSFDCSRLEITICPQKYKSFSPLLPDIFSDAPLQLSAEFEELDFTAKAIILHPDLIPVLQRTVHRNTFMRYKKYIDVMSNNALSLDESSICTVEKYLKDNIAKYNSKIGLEKLLYS